jgi:septum formation protein
VQYILGSRSPRRRDLLALVVPPASISIRPPSDPAEADFVGLTDLPAIQQRLAEIARKKYADVVRQVHPPQTTADRQKSIVIAADTTIVASRRDGTPIVVGQPPEEAHWPETVRLWFREYFAGKPHAAVTCLIVGIPGGATVERFVETQVEFIADVDRYLEWYLNTGESRGKAGGYALQGAGSVFISRVTGSLTNVIGLPLEALLECFAELHVNVD